MVVGLAAPPADPMTVCPLSLATWHTTDPTAPDAAETNITSPSLSIAILSKATQAVSPGPPVVDNRAPVRWIVGHRNHSDRIYADEMRSLGITIYEKLTDDLLAQTIGIGHALVRTQVLQPRVRQKCFDETAILSRILKKSPVVSAIATALACIAPQRLQKRQAALRIDVPLHRHQ